jgi:hypothetical protein
VTGDHALSFVVDGKAKWRREEALATTTHVEFVDLPYQLDSSMQTNPIGSTVKDLIQKVSGLSAPTRAGAFVNDFRVMPQSDKPLFTDKFQIRKLAVVITNANKIFAIETVSSQIIWSKYFGGSPGSLKRLFKLRNTGRLAPECTVVLMEGNSTSTQGCSLFSFNPLNGKETSKVSLSNPVKHLIPLPDRDDEHRRILMVVSHNNEVSAFPASSTAQAALLKRAGKLFWYDIDKASSSASGYQVSVDKAGSETKFSSEQTWEVRFPSGESIDAVAGRSTEENIFAPYYVTGSHDVMYKYLNPNMICISTTSSSAPFFKGTRAVTSAVSEGAASTPTPSVHLYCVDTVKGHILYHVAHPMSKGPTHIAMSENWVAHTFWSERNLQTEMSVLELWEDHPVEENVMEVMMNGMGFGVQKKANQYVKKKHFATGDEEGETFSSFAKHSPVKEEQSYIFPAVVKVMGVTTSETGITSKTLLVGTSADQLYGMPKKMFDARRPVKAPTQEEMEEGLMQYNPILPFIPTDVLSYNKTVAGIRGIKAVPAGGLESTSLVMAYGIDMFFTPVAPSKTFDMLPEDFQFSILAMTIVGLVVAVFAASMASKRKDLNMLWK